MFCLFYIYVIFAVIAEISSEMTDLDEFCDAKDAPEPLNSFRKLYRPRGAFARTLYDKIINDKNLEEFDRNQWYECDTRLLGPEARALWLPMSLDAETNTFLDLSCQKSDWIITQMWHSLASAILSWFMTRTSINGLLGRGSMFVFSREQFSLLVPDPRGRLLDLGAGDGMVTSIMAPHFKEVMVTEVSSTMRRQLSLRGFTVLEVETWQQEAPYDLISCLNVLDRCSRPVSLLHEIREALRPRTGRAIIALVLPFQPYVETGQSDHRPEEYLPISGQGFEAQVSSAICMFTDAGFVVERWTRVPYLCEGDLGQSFYWLDDAVFVLSPLT